MEDSLDQFYTKPEIALYCVNKVKEFYDEDDFDVILEPSAGKGAFYQYLSEQKRMGIDIEPKCDGVAKQDFLTFEFDASKKYMVIGNPPFGRVCSMAIKFFNYSAKFSDVIAFIIPRTFKRVSVQNQLDLNFKLLFSEDLPVKPGCFDPHMGAKCCFQIWKKDIVEKRKKIIYPSIHPDFTFLKLGPLDKKGQPTCPINADFVIKAYGSNCGEIVSEGLDKLRPKSWHWIKSNIDIEILKSRFLELDYSISKDTVRQDSIGQQELIYLYSCKF